ncbi:hypothetical protein [Spirosoma sp.]|uniref:hypothetical protein n=1 Tax=Spirosoma sp. TaxID=1899569 RepID=UPI00260CF372|nr:hypothetical protein [Spirosoma sp.]MCX6214863.1 hypothetical protein [Spirosoma sp.]
MAKSILLIGRNPMVLANLASALTAEDFLVQTTDQVEQASDQFNAVDFDLIAFGRGVDEATNASLKANFSAQNPDVVFVDGLAPVVPLLVKQIKQALVSNQTSAKKLIKFTCQQTEQLVVQVTVTAACQLTIDLYRLDAVHTTHQQTLVSSFVMAGNHTFRLNEKADSNSTINFLAASADKAELLVLPLRTINPT